MAAEGAVINFYRQHEVPYGAFSNFSQHPIRLDGASWPTTEHYFQAMKFHPHSPADVELVRQAPSPGQAARAGRSTGRPLRRDWEAVKDDVMFRACCAKFTQHAELRKLLLGTGDATLVENTHNDSYWGDGGDGSGKNMLGITLMKVRSWLQRQQAGMVVECALQLPALCPPAASAWGGEEGQPRLCAETSPPDAALILGAGYARVIGGNGGEVVAAAPAVLVELMPEHVNWDAFPIQVDTTPSAAGGADAPSPQLRAVRCSTARSVAAEEQPIFLYERAPEHEEPAGEPSSAEGGAGPLLAGRFYLDAREIRVEWPAPTALQGEAKRPKRKPRVQ